MPPTAAVTMIDGGNRSPSTAPTPMPPHAPLRVGMESLLMWSLPSDSLVMTAES